LPTIAAVRKAAAAGPNSATRPKATDACASGSSAQVMPKAATKNVVSGHCRTSDTVTGITLDAPHSARLVAVNGRGHFGRASSARHHSHIEVAMRGHTGAAVVLSLMALAPRLAAQDAAPAAATEGPTVTEAAVGTAVTDRQLQGAAETFPATVGTVFFFTRIGSTQAGTEVEHVWYHADQEVGRKALSIGGSPWRTWSSKIIPPEATGSWRVDVVSNGAVIKSVSFTVQ
jgi:hypothetical protein